VPALAAGASSRIVVVAHGNALRSLLQRVEGLSLEEVARLALPRATPLHYRFEATAVAAAAGAAAAEGNAAGRAAAGGTSDDQDEEGGGSRELSGGGGGQGPGPELFYRHTVVGFEPHVVGGKVGLLRGRSLAGDFAQRLQQEKNTLDEVLISGAAL
jgi:hypothetical protein